MVDAALSRKPCIFDDLGDFCRIWAGETFGLQSPGIEGSNDIKGSVKADTQSHTEWGAPRASARCSLCSCEGDFTAHGGPAGSSFRRPLCLSVRTRRLEVPSVRPWGREAAWDAKFAAGVQG